MFLEFLQEEDVVGFLSVDNSVDGKPVYMVTFYNKALNDIVDPTPLPPSVAEVSDGPVLSGSSFLSGKKLVAVAGFACYMSMSHSVAARGSYDCVVSRGSSEDSYSYVVPKDKGFCLVSVPLNIEHFVAFKLIGDSKLHISESESIYVSGNGFYIKNVDDIPVVVPVQIDDCTFTFTLAVPSEVKVALYNKDRNYSDINDSGTIEFVSIGSSLKENMVNIVCDSGFDYSFSLGGEKDDVVNEGDVDAGRGYEMDAGAEYDVNNSMFDRCVNYKSDFNAYFVALHQCVDEGMNYPMCTIGNVSDNKENDEFFWWGLVFLSGVMVFRKFNRK